MALSERLQVIRPGLRRRIAATQLSRVRPTRPGVLRRSLRNRLTLMFFAITFVAIAVLYLFVAPGLRSRLVNARLTELATAARTDSGQVTAVIGPGSRFPKSV